MLDRFKVVWTRAAIIDLDQIIDYVALDAGVDRALRLYEKIRDKVDSLSQLAPLLAKLVCSQMSADECLNTGSSAECRSTRS